MDEYAYYEGEDERNDKEKIVIRNVSKISIEEFIEKEERKKENGRTNQT